MIDVIVSVLIPGALVLMVPCLRLDICSCPTAANLVSPPKSQQDRPAVAMKHTNALLAPVAGCREDHTPGRACASFSHCILPRKVPGLSALPTDTTEEARAASVPPDNPSPKGLVQPSAAGARMLRPQHNRQRGILFTPSSI